MKPGIALVNYLNSRPFLLGLSAPEVRHRFRLDLLIPSACTQAFLSGRDPVVLLPVAALKQCGPYHLFSDFCIGADGLVDTVCLYSNESPEELRKVYLDTDSTTSAQLLRILYRDFWKRTPEFLPALHMPATLGRGEGALMIGDKCFEQQGRFSCVTDLAAAWKSHTGKPFVFAAWVSREPLSPEDSLILNDALSYGVSQIPALAAILQRGESRFDVREYYEERISYSFNDAKREALSLFLSLIREDASAGSTSLTMPSKSQSARI